MRRGFTLIELLAVIVILAIIAVIAVPIVINIIDDSKKNATLRSADFYLDAVEMSVAQVTLQNQNIPEGTYNILESGNICLSYDSENKCKEELKVEVNGEVPEIGTVTIIGGEVTGLNIKLNEKEIYKTSKNEMVYVKFLNEVCEPAKEQLYAEESYEAGYKYNCKVDPNKEPYSFYVLNTSNANGEIITQSVLDDVPVSINLIMDSNINISGEAVKSGEMEDKGLVPWINLGDYISSGGSSEEYNKYTPDLGNSSKGPITAMSHLQEATKNWTNTNEMTINSFDTYSYDGQYVETKNMYKEYNTYARMPLYYEVSAYEEVKNNAYLYDNLEPMMCTISDGDSFYNVVCDSDYNNKRNYVNGSIAYWLSTANSHDIQLAAFFMESSASGSSGYLGDNVVSCEAYGVRPVITLNL